MNTLRFLFARVAFVIGPPFLSTHKRASNARSRLHRYTHENGNASAAAPEITISRGQL